MHVRLLGTAAGGGFPQWNCNCGNCRSARRDPTSARPRTQSCLAISADGHRWFLVNASPDVRAQIESFPPLWPPPQSTRGTVVAGVLLTNADLDHVLGLFHLREGGPLVVHASDAVRRSLVEGLRIDAIIDSYNGIAWRTPPRELSPLLGSDGSDSGLLYKAFDVAGKPPRYRPDAPHAEGDAIGYRFVDLATGGRAVILPDVAAFDDRVAREAETADLLLLDGTFFDDDEMARAGTGTATAAEMGHLIVGGPHGNLARIAGLTGVTRVYVHVNNTNPMLLEGSPQRVAVEAAGVRVGLDGMSFSL